MKTKQYTHQREEFRAHADDEARALLWQMRTGKSKACVDVACRRFLADEIDAVLVLAPNGPHASWVLDEVPRHSWDFVDYVAHHWRSVPPALERQHKEHAARLKAVLAEPPRRRLVWVSVNSEALQLARVKAAVLRMIKRLRTMLVVDEVDDFRTPGSKRSKRVRALARYCPVRMILSGTISANTPLAVWAPFEILQKGALGHESFTTFKAEFAEYETETSRGGRTYPVFKRYRNIPRLRARMARWSSVVLREDCEDLPEMVESTHRFEMTPAQAALYERTREDCLLRLDETPDEELTPLTGGALLIKLQQITSGFAIDADGRVHDVVPDERNPRLRALEAEVRDAMDKVVVWVKFREDAARVLRLFERMDMEALPHIGGMGPARQREHRRRFQEERNVRGIVMTTGGRGTDLSAAGSVIWYSHTFDLIHRLQGSERASAMGKTAVGLVDLVAEGTVDGKMLAALREKRTLFQELSGRGLRDEIERILRDDW